MNEEADAMTEFGHNFYREPGLCLDSWGAGPFMIEIGGKKFTFEDSDRFGPLLLGKRGEPLADQPGERNKFWKAYTPWRNQGRRLAEDGKTCIYDPLRTMIVRHIVGRHYMLVQDGDENGGVVVLKGCGNP